MTDSQEKNAWRFSLAGVQLKFSAIMDATGGLTIPVGGVNGRWIVKLPSVRFPSVPENEYSMMQFAKKIGIDIPEVKLVETDSIGGLPPDLPEDFGKSLIVRRFDRDEFGNRIHIEDFAQVYELFPEQKYQDVSYRDIASLLWIESGPSPVAEFVRRLVFSIGIGNADMHSKNWSLIYPNNRNPKLSPAYDFVSTIAYLSDNKLALSLANKKNMYEITIDHFRRLAAKAALPEKLVLDTVAETVNKMHDNWKEVKTSFPLSSLIAKTEKDICVRFLFMSLH